MWGATTAAGAGGPATRAGLSAASRYLNEQFPPAQAAALAVTTLVMWALLGRIAGHMTLDAAALVAAGTVALLFLQLRLFDDVHTYYDSDGTGDIGGATLPQLLVGIAVTTVAVAAVNVFSPLVLATALAVTLGMAATSLIVRMETTFGPRARFLLGRLPLFEVLPAAALAYVYAAWATARDASLSAGDVAAVVLVVWAAFNVWKLSRHLGELPRERIYELTWPAVRALCLGLLAMSLALVVMLVDRAELSFAYLAYAAVTIVVFALLAAPRRAPDIRRPAWVGLPFPVAMIAGLLVQLLLLA